MRPRDRKRRNECLTALGGRCVRCGCHDLNKLTIDHVNNDGYKDFGQGRRRYVFRLSGSNLYSFLKAMKYTTKREYQLLCGRCHASKGNWFRSVRNKR